MAFEAVRSITLPVALATVIAQGRFVTIDTNGLCVYPEDGGGTGADNVVVGISLAGSTATESAALPIAILDGAKIEVETGAEAIAVGASVTTDTQGRAKPGDTTGDAIVGLSLDASDANSGAFITLLAARGARAAT